MLPLELLLWQTVLRLKQGIQVKKKHEIWNWSTENICKYANTLHRHMIPSSSFTVRTKCQLVQRQVGSVTEVSRDFDAWVRCFGLITRMIFGVSVWQSNTLERTAQTANKSEHFYLYKPKSVFETTVSKLIPSVLISILEQWALD